MSCEVWGIEPERGDMIMESNTKQNANPLDNVIKLKNSNCKILRSIRNERRVEKNK